MKELQMRLLRAGQYIPHVPHQDKENIAQYATTTATSSLKLSRVESDGTTKPLTRGGGMLLPVLPGKLPSVTFLVDVAKATTLHVEARTSDRPENTTPDVILGAQDIAVQPGERQEIRVEFDAAVTEARYVLYCIGENDNASLHCSCERVTGIVAVYHRYSHTFDPGLGVESYEVWSPDRDPRRRNYAIKIEPPITGFLPQCAANGYARPTARTNAWVADFGDASPAISLAWGTPQTISHVQITFDNDWDHPMESVLWPHTHHTVPFCVRNYRILGDIGALLYEKKDNHQTRNMITFPKPVRASRLTIECLSNWAAESEVQVPPAAIFDIQVYESDPTKIV
jgi:hypothetical protein